MSKLLGHANVLMTQKYAHLSPEATGAEATAVLDGLHENRAPIIPAPVPSKPEIQHDDQMNEALAALTERASIKSTEGDLSHRTHSRTH